MVIFIRISHWSRGWLVVFLEHECYFSIGNNHSNWLSYFSERLKPPTSYWFILIQSIGEERKSWDLRAVLAGGDFNRTSWLAKADAQTNKLPASAATCSHNEIDELTSYSQLGLSQVWVFKGNSLSLRTGWADGEPRDAQFSHPKSWPWQFIAIPNLGPHHMGAKNGQTPAVVSLQLIGG